MDRVNEITRRGIMVERANPYPAIKFRPFPVPNTSYIHGILTDKTQDWLIAFADQESAQIIIHGELAAEGQRVTPDPQVRRLIEVVLPEALTPPVVINVESGGFEIEMGPTGLVASIEEGLPPEEPLYLGEDTEGRRYRARFF